MNKCLRLARPYAVAYRPVSSSEQIAKEAEISTCFCHVIDRAGFSIQLSAWRRLMKTRHVYSASELAIAHAAMDAARRSGVDNDGVSLIARSDIELEAIPDDRKVVDGDFYPAAIRGVTGGAVVGLLAGLVAVAVPPIGLTLAGAGLTTLAGAAMGGWATALAGSAVPDPVRREFEKEIAAGRILVVLDAEDEVLEQADRTVCETGARRLPFDRPSVMT